MNEGKIFLVNVSKGRIGEDNSALLGGMIITKMQLAAMERVRIPEDERKDFYLYVDEFQNFATDSFANILSEARKYRLNLIIAHQYTAQLSNENGTAVRDAVFGNVGTMIIFRVGADDADFLEKEFEPEFTAQDLVNLPNYHVYLKLMIDGITSRPFSASTLPPIKFNASLGVKEQIIESSRNLYTKSREEVEADINKWSGMLQVGDGDAKYKADCSNCGKVTMVPFEPQEGRPVYCKDCMFKIKSGELVPKVGFSAPRSARQEEKTSMEPLAALGIEFTSNGGKAPEFKQQQKYTKPGFNNSKESMPGAKPGFNNQNYKNNNGEKHRSAGPSPLLKGLLQKIGVAGNEKNLSKIEEQISEVKVPTPASVSLSTLKKPTPSADEKKVVAPIPTKEASEEKKASLKDLLSKISTASEDKEVSNTKKEDVTPAILPKVDLPKPEVKIESKVEETFVAPKIDEVKITPPLPKEEIKEELPKVQEMVQPKPRTEDVNPNTSTPPAQAASSWQNPKAQKEIPEEVLRKILEE
jgi:CxxC-x17-CxxC domain-containing protein